jgi:hypothetical protein
MSMELATMLPNENAHTSVEESTPAVTRDPQWIETALTLLLTSFVVVIASVLAVAMSLS